MDNPNTPTGDQPDIYSIFHAGEKHPSGLPTMSSPSQAPQTPLGASQPQTANPFRASQTPQSAPQSPVSQNASQPQMAQTSPGTSPSQMPQMPRTSQTPLGTGQPQMAQSTGQPQMAQPSPGTSPSQMPQMPRASQPSPGTNQPPASQTPQSASPSRAAQTPPASQNASQPQASQTPAAARAQTEPASRRNGASGYPSNPSRQSQVVRQSVLDSPYGNTGRYPVVGAPRPASAPTPDQTQVVSTDTPARADKAVPAKAQMDRYIGHTLDKRYEILEEIGSGGMAVVYKAHDELLKRFVAIKILRDDMAGDVEFRERFQKEAEAVARLQHPNIVSVYDVSRHPGLDYIVMELVEGVSLKQYLRSKGRLSCTESVHFASQVAKALSQAHSKGIIHRDIKPQNIMIALDGSAKVADFGIAFLETAKAQEQALAREGEQEEQTPEQERGTAIGSVHYISPEQAKGQTPDARSDIYSLGVVMYEMLTGELPFTGDTAESIALQHVSTAPRPLREIDPNIPVELEEITLRAMSKDLTQRYPSAAALLKALDRYRAHEVKQVNDEEKLRKAIPKDVEPLARTGEMRYDSFARRRRRANKISLLLGFGLVIVFILSVFSFLWNYWLSDVFSDPVRVMIPNFVGSDFEDIVHNSELRELYRFTITEQVDPDVQEGQILAQSPEQGRSVMQTNEPIKIELTVSSGTKMLTMPDVTNQEYKMAIGNLESMGFQVEADFQLSSTVTANYIISSNPEAGDELATGSRVYLTVSAGATAVMTDMPNLIGLTESVAVTRLERYSLVLGAVTPVAHDMPAGTVVAQSVDAGTQVQEHTKIFLQVSTGPSESEGEGDTGEDIDSEENGDAIDTGDGDTITEEAPEVWNG